MADELVQVTKTFNTDIKTLVQQLDRYCTEINRAASGNVAMIISHDLNRFRGYIASLQGFHDFILATPNPLDLPESHPAGWSVEPMELYEPVDNPVCNSLVITLVSGRSELLSSQSAGIATGLLPFDSARFVAVLGKCTNLLDYAENHQPEDMPESLPHYPSVKVGSRGPHDMPTVAQNKM